MPVPALFQGRMAVPAIAAPMFLVSGPDLVINACKAGIAASFPSLNARPASQLDEWLTRMNGELGPKDAPFGINLILPQWLQTQMGYTATWAGLAVAGAVTGTSSATLSS